MRVASAYQRDYEREQRQKTSAEPAERAAPAALIPCDPAPPLPADTERRTAPLLKGMQARARELKEREQTRAQLAAAPVHTWIWS